MSTKLTDTSGGSTADILPKGSVTPVGDEADSEVGRAMQVIVNHLCKKYQATGVNEPIAWYGLWQELGIEGKIFDVALNKIVNSVDVEQVGHDLIQLGPRGRLRCKG